MRAPLAIASIVLLIAGQVLVLTGPLSWILLVLALVLAFPASRAASLGALGLFVVILGAGLFAVGVTVGGVGGVGGGSPHLPALGAGLVAAAPALASGAYLVLARAPARGLAIAGVSLVVAGIAIFGVILLGDAGVVPRGILPDVATIIPMLLGAFAILVATVAGLIPRAGGRASTGHPFAPRS